LKLQACLADPDVDESTDVSSDEIGVRNVRKLVIKTGPVFRPYFWSFPDDFPLTSDLSGWNHRQVAGLPKLRQSPFSVRIFGPILAVSALLYHYAALRGFRRTRCHEDYRNIKIPYTYGKVICPIILIPTLVLHKCAPMMHRNTG